MKGAWPALLCRRQGRRHHAELLPLPSERAARRGAAAKRCASSRTAAPANEDRELLRPSALTRQCCTPLRPSSSPRRQCCVATRIHFFDTLQVPLALHSTLADSSSPSSPTPAMLHRRLHPFLMCVFSFLFLLDDFLADFFLRLVWIVSIPLSHPLESLQFHRYHRY